MRDPRWLTWLAHQLPYTLTAGVLATYTGALTAVFTSGDVQAFAFGFTAAGLIVWHAPLLVVGVGRLVCWLPTVLE